MNKVAEPLPTFCSAITIRRGAPPITFPKNYEQLPAFEDYSMQGRTCRFMTAEPLYRFGYGLSYTTFKYTKLKVRGTEVSVAVKNTGARAGDEVVQLYVRDVAASVPVPQRHLEGFQRIISALARRRL